MRKFFVALLITLVSFLLSYLFNYFYLDLTKQSFINQLSLLIFSTCPLIYLTYTIWNERANLQFKVKLDFANTKNLFKENFAGILLAIFFFSVYAYLGLWLNQLGPGQVDNLFDADIASWIHRISYPDVQDFPMRGPHPFTYFIIRPFGLILNLITNNPPNSAILFNAMVGGGCVFLTWLFINGQFQSKVYAFLIASLLGISTSHLFFGFAVESYIFSAFALILFFLYLKPNTQSMGSLVGASVITFGITLTNFVQNLIGFAVARPRIKEIYKFVALVMSISLLLSFFHAVVYPESRLFFLASDARKEKKFFVNLFNQPDWKVEGRIEYLFRTEFLYTVVAPKTFILTEEVGSFIPEFRFFKISTNVFHQTNYENLGQALVAVWAIALLVSGVVMIWNLIRTKKVDMSLSFALCLVFNFVLHIFYGQELFLYSADWAYALIFFVAFGLSPFAKNRLFQSGFLVFVLLLAINQWQFLQSVFGTLVQFMESLN